MDKNSIFNESTNQALYDYLSICSNYTQINVNKAYNLALTALKYYKGNQTEKEDLRIFQDLETAWYKSLEDGKPDYSLYNHVAFLSDVWACWIIYSRKYLQGIASTKSMNGKSVIEDMGFIDSAVDLGCGFGYTTAGLKELFPEAEVYGTNLDTSCQFKVATHVGNERGFKVVPFVESIGIDIDLVFASEYFEHFERPVEHLLDVLNHCKPYCLIIANAFNSRSVGHFITYKHRRKAFTGKEMSRFFNDSLREVGYKKVKTKLWNDRPTYWRKDEP